MSEIPVVKIECDWAAEGFRLINASEFDEATMKMYTEPKAPEPKKGKEK